jgi:hypothetical protein
VRLEVADTGTSVLNGNFPASLSSATRLVDFYIRSVRISSEAFSCVSANRSSVEDYD